MMGTMFLAQAFGEYAAMAAVTEAITSLSIRLEAMMGEWGTTEAILALVVAAVLWRIVSPRK